MPKSLARCLTHYGDIDAYVTRDESTIRELMHPDLHAVTNQSLAEAVVPIGKTTRMHFHRTTEEIYHITDGRGLMTLGEERFTVAKGDTIRIAPGTKHCIKNTGQSELSILCSCVPAYSHEDTVLVDEE